MKAEKYKNYLLTSFLIIDFGLILLAGVFLLNLNDFTQFIIFILASGCFVIGIYTLTLQKPDSLDPAYFSLLPVQGIINMGELFSASGERPQSYFGPAEQNKSEIMHYVRYGENQTYSMQPLSLPLAQKLLKDNYLVIPSDQDELFKAIKEVYEETLDVVDSLLIQPRKDTILITLKDFRLFDGCKYVYMHDRGRCTYFPCPICSLGIWMISRGLHKTVLIKSVDINLRERSVSIEMKPQ